MRPFFLIAPSERDVDDVQRAHQLAQLNIDLIEWDVRSARHIVFGIMRRGRGAAPDITVSTAYAAIGHVRLDNRESVERRFSLSPNSQSIHTCSDLALAAGALARAGTDGLADLIGDFAFAFYNNRTGDVIGARDAFGVRSLYWRQLHDVFAISSRSTPLGTDGKYSEDYLAEFLTNSISPEEQSVYRNVQAVAAGGYIVKSTRPRAAIRLGRYWKASDHTSERPLAADEAVHRFHELFEEAVQVRLSRADTAWSRLSGGLDSSAIVCTAASLARRGKIARALAGTVTTVDTLGRGDERDFSNAVAQAAQVPNAQVVDPWLWQDDGRGPPFSDEPRPMYPFFGREWETLDLIVAGNVDVLLCGIGADNYLSSTLRIISDRLVVGVLPALREAWRWSVSERQSTWRYVLRYLILPSLPVYVRSQVALKNAHVPKWIDERFARRTAMRDRLPAARGAKAQVGKRFRLEIEAQLAVLPSILRRGMFDEAVDMRYPFLHRPLVEFALSTPSELRMRPGASKWLLREATRDVLPAIVYARRGKGSIGARLLWSIHREKSLIDALLEQSILADLGCINISTLKRQIDLARSGAKKKLGRALHALSLETWLQVRSGTWDRISTKASTARSPRIAANALGGVY